MSQTYHHHQHILSPKPKSTLVNGSNGPNGIMSTTTTSSNNNAINNTTVTNGTSGTNGINNKPLSTSTFTQEIARAMQASSSQQPKYASYPYVEDRFEHPPPPPPSPVGWSR
ncbi:hypothetical protein GX50_00618 [[Emmonsia] crescens]|uniref:Uncharacterized protein n=1 Tax=[Emmonsia] crescens TaxID=73230 RepID=A0A2B7ZT62_9EURO|nr:hypothetical protein GX50_00618 [Emmonsia crescens]